MADATTGPEDEDDDQEALEAGRLLFAQACDFIAGARVATQLPAASLTEIAFAGRSNVGKSSLINALTGRNSLARTSNTPGRTREINFFNLGGRLSLVDLPGYGYAKAAKTEIERWNTLILQYLRGRVSLRRVCLLIDSRRGIGEADRAVMKTLDGSAVVFQVVLTKIDKVKPGERQALLESVAAEIAKHPAAHPQVVPTSAAKNEGIAELRAALAMLVETG
tara:strand:+ start:504 stop:1169 length:666 start_codon:yes stop_codon:yes gene_type:complete